QVTPGLPDVFVVPDLVKEVKITALPVPPEWWRADVVLSVQPDGTLSLKDRGDAVAVDIQQLPNEGTLIRAKVILRLSRVKVVTDQIVAALRHVPPLIRVEPGTDAHVRLILDSANRERQLAVDALLGPTTPISGTALQLPPRSLSTIDPTHPVSGGLLRFQTGPVAPSNDTFVVEVAGNSVVPRTIAVSWPGTVPRGQPAPMYVYFRHAPAQESGNMMLGLYDDSLGTYPYSFDYAYFALLSCLWYSIRPDLWPYSQGIPYQIEAAGKNVVTIVACPTARPNNKSTQFGDWTNAEFMQSILLEIQALAAARGHVALPTSLGRVALGAFSSSHIHLLYLLNNGKGHPFLTGTVKECYLFDPDNLVLKDLMPHLLDWEKGVPSSAAVIRLYNHRSMPEQAPLITPVPTKTPHLTKAKVGNRTVFAAQSSDWDRSIAALHGKPSAKSWAWPDQHFAISAFMLTHAIASSGF
ncbi:hypothetical protein, partial [Nocardioides sp.]|uniref:hypothetical protein n=1 Tax=Nocardioides sp. TaxID=35761 RepID=UPI002F43013C